MAAPALLDYQAPMGMDPQSGIGAQSSALVNRTITYTYDPLNRLTAADYDDGTYFHYVYDAVGNRMSQETLAGTNTYAYDIANRLTSVDGVAYAWDANGNLLSDGVTTYAYNYANMLASVNQGGIVYTYAYSGLGDRLQQAVDGVPTNYSLDINPSTSLRTGSGLTQVLADGTNAYLYGLGRIAQEGASVEYFLGDALSSVRQLVDYTAGVTLTQSYEPYGNALTSEGEGKSVFQFTGEARDGTNLTYLRARNYESAYGRFTTKDVWEGDYDTPMSYNAWLYGYSNPVKYMDPTGEFPCENCDRFRTDVSTALRNWCYANCCERRWGDVNLAQTWDYSGIGAGNWAADHMFDYNNACGESCTEFVSTALVKGGGAPTTEKWNPDIGCLEKNPWISTDAFYDFLVNTLRFNVLNVDLSDPNRFFRQNYIPPGSIVFYDVGNFASIEFPGVDFGHAAITTGNTVEGFSYENALNQYVDLSGQYGPEVADHNGHFSPSGPHLLYQTFNPAVKIEIALKP